MKKDLNKTSGLSHVVQVRAEGPKAPSPGHRPGYDGKQQDALYGQKLYVLSGVLKLLPLQGDRFASVITQGAALGWGLLPFQGVWGLLAKAQ